MFHDIQIVIITNIVVVSSVGIKSIWATVRNIFSLKLNKWPIVDWIDSPILYIGRVEWLGDVAIPTEKWLNHLQTVETLIRWRKSAVWSGSALFAIYPLSPAYNWQYLNVQMLGREVTSVAEESFNCLPSNNWLLGTPTLVSLVTDP